MAKYKEKAQKMTSSQKRAFLEALERLGTKKKACEEAGVSPWMIRVEEQKSAIFRRRVVEAKQAGVTRMADEALERIRAIASGELETDKTVLTANLALANAYESGFKGVQRTEGHVDHNIRVITGIPRPNYEALEKPKSKLLKEGAIEEDGNET